MPLKFNYAQIRTGKRRKEILAQQCKFNLNLLQDLWGNIQNKPPHGGVGIWGKSRRAAQGPRLAAGY